ncbi:CapA family protein [Thalassobacillus sp. B23F22_16]|uniref:CapA family protein n=1 Tax=Thalassobacillus sp. B23F22_16 TaxID=3459513 RepID=UPI00373E0A9B
MKLFVCGDVVNYEKEDGIFCSKDLANIISTADYSICNFEAPIEGVGYKRQKVGKHHFQRKSTISGLKHQGFDLLCLANNHIMDFGEKALQVTIQEAKNQGLDTIGAGKNFSEAYKPIVKTFNNIKVGFVNACEAQFGVLDYSSHPGHSGYAWINHSTIDQQIMQLKMECDFIILLAHAGLEHYNIPQKEWRMRYKHLCELGVDVVIASHPHVPQGYEKFKNSLIFYSLGNFYFDSENFKMKQDNSFSVILDLQKGKEINFELVYHHKENGQLQLSPKDKQVDLYHLNQMLNVNYEQLCEEMSVNIFNNKIRKNLVYSLVPFTYNGELFSSAKLLIKKILGKQNNNKELLALHLLKNETYFYAAKHALEIRAKGKDY